MVGKSKSGFGFKSGFDDFVKSILVVFCDTALTRGHYFDKHDKSRHYLTLMTVDSLDSLRSCTCIDFNYSYLDTVVKF